MSQDVSASEALAVTRATLAYNQIEDRISLTCAVNNDQCVVLWLTARLASRLVPHLCHVVTQFPDTLLVAGSAQRPAPEAPVVAGADSPAWVVTAIDLTNGPMLLQLGFRDNQGHAPVLFSLEHTQLAEWSEGLKRCYADAGWSMDCWHMPVGVDPQSHATRRVALH